MKNLSLLKIICFILIYCISLSTIAEEKPLKNCSRDKFSKKEILKDIKFIQRALTIHPSPYEVISKEELAKKFEDIKANLPDSLSRREFYNLIAPVVASLQDGHTSIVVPSDSYWNYVENGGKVFPFEVYIENDELFIKKCKDSNNEIPVHSEITSIKKLSADSILERLRLNYGAFSKKFKDSYIAKEFDYHLYNTFAMKDNFEIVYIDAEFRKPLFLREMGVEYKEEPAKPMFDYKKMKGSVGYLEINNMVLRSRNELQKLHKDIDSLFHIICNSKIDNLIIDLRNNLGGSIFVSDVFLSHLTDEPYAYVKRQYSILNKENRAFYQRSYKEGIGVMFYYVFPLFPFFSTERELFLERDEVVREFVYEPRMHKIVPDSLFFKGKQTVLINEMTFSSAAMFANVFKCFGNATLIGTETGTPLIQAGEVYRLETPKTNLKLGVSQKKFYYPCTENIETSGKNQGVLPDIEINDSYVDFKTEDDPVIQKALEVIGND